MIDLLKIIWKFVTRIIVHFFKGEFALALYLIAGKLPLWLFDFNKAAILYTEDFNFPETINPEVNIKIAEKSNIDDIHRISMVQKDHIEKMMDNGAVCLIASIGKNGYSSVAWAAFGKCYIRGMGYLLNFGDNSHYTFGLYTIPEARRRGMNLALFTASIKYAIEKNISKFYSMVEFPNHYALRFHEKLGYKQISNITFIKFLSVIINVERDLATNKLSTKLYFGEPKDKMAII